MDIFLKKLSDEYFDGRLKSIFSEVINSYENVEEIRITANAPLCVLRKSGIYFISESGEEVEAKKAARFTEKEIADILLKLCDSSIYSHMDRLKDGYITLRGGHRCGITGRCVMEDGKIKYITDISSIVIRIAREIKGASMKVMEHIVGERIKSALIISPPGAGKTTLIRDIARSLAGDTWKKKVAIIDERSEIAASRNGVPNMDVGYLSSVLTYSPKKEGIEQVLRSISPNVIITDEIGKKEDFEAIKRASLAGVSVIATLHADSIDDLYKERVGELIALKIFDTIIHLSRENGPGTIKEIRELNA